VRPNIVAVIINVSKILHMLSVKMKLSVLHTQCWFSSWNWRGWQVCSFVLLADMD